MGVGYVTEIPSSLTKALHMKTQRVAIAIALAAGVAVGGVYGAKVIAEKNRIQSLLETKQCLDCNLQGANLARLDLKQTNLEGANLKGANLRGASLGNANLERANLQNANLEGADLGCNAFSFRLRADGDSNFGFQVDRSPIAPPPESHLASIYRPQIRVQP
ncbi:MAG: pentapeptide repeat-containing protein [Leptolyngbyaceae cyanobacterium CRU_2_3]|nr:pentapeptide repeat-containing protein [Leptolyngbyaceae cyanobacterium CRU_2_3]